MKKSPTITQLKYDKRKKCIGKSVYKHVAIFELLGVTYFKAQIHKFKWFKYCDSEKEAAKAVDLKLIEKGLKPVNILKEKEIGLKTSF